MKCLLSFLFVLALSIACYAQQFYFTGIRSSEIPAIEMMFNRKYINPTYTGDTDAINLRNDFYLMKEWVGIDGGPSRFENASEGHIKSINSGFAMSYSHSRNGAIVHDIEELFYNYRIPLAKDCEFRLGTSIALSRTWIDQGMLILNDPDYKIDTRKYYFLPIKLGFSFVLKNHLIGFSYNNLFTDSVTFIHTRTISNLILNYSVNILPHSYFSIRPEILLQGFIDPKYFRLGNLNRNNILLGCSFGYKKIVHLGMYLTDKNIYAGTISVRIFNFLDLGYMYNYQSSPLFTSIGGSHFFRVGFVFDKLFK